MKRLIILISVLLCISCSADNNTNQSIIFDNVLTLDFSFGDEDSISDLDYLLARPHEVVVKNNGDIVVLDENSLKVFDSNGKPKQLVGKKGQGPGEFDGVYRMKINHSDDITVAGGSYIHYISNEFRFKSKINFYNNEIRKNILKENNWAFAISRDAMYINNDRLIMHFAATETSDFSGNKEYNHVSLVNDSTFTTLVNRHIELSSVKVITNKTGSMAFGFSFSDIGTLTWDIMDDKEIVYINTWDDNILNDDKAVYYINITDLASGDSTQISHDYERLPITEERISELDYFEEAYDEYPELKTWVNEVKDNFREIKYTKMVSKILIDDNLLFAFTYKKKRRRAHFS